MPHHARDPIPIACEMVGAFQSMVTRRVDVFDPAVVTVARIQAGTTSNVIPETAELYGTVRTVSEKARDSVLADIEQVAQGLASAHGATAEISIVRGYPVTVNDPDAAAVRPRHRRRAARRRQRRRDADAGDGRRGLVVRAPAGARRHGVPRHPPRRAWRRTTSPPTTRTAWCSTRSAMAVGIATYAGVTLRWLAGAR